MLALHPVDDSAMVVLGGGVLHTLEQLEDVAEQVSRNKRALFEETLIDHSTPARPDAVVDGASPQSTVTVLDAGSGSGRS